MVNIGDEQKKCSDWRIIRHGKSTPDKPILIEGLPGIGNVGKIVMDMLIESTKAKKIVSFFSHHLPSAVFIRENNLISTPGIALYHKRIGKQDFLFMTGDTQPVREEACYTLCEETLTLLDEWHAKLIITIGGIGLDHVPEQPHVFCSGTDKASVASFTKNTTAEKSIYGIVGPIMGVTGVLLGNAQRRKLPAITLLAETFGHPLYLGLKGARAILSLLDKKYTLGVRFKDLDKEITFVEDQLQGNTPPKSKFKPVLTEKMATNYIG
ncbi:MAG: PAC2 family protein [archaeon]